MARQELEVSAVSHTFSKWTRGFASAACFLLLVLLFPSTICILKLAKYDRNYTNTTMQPEQELEFC